MSSQRQKLVLWGAGGHARVVAELAALEGRFEVVGLIDDVNPERHGTAPFGVPILGGADVLPGLHSRGVRHLLVAIGSCRARLELTEQAERLGFSCPVLVHPRAFVSPSASVGAGSVVAAAGHVGPGSTIGRASIVNTGASVDHDCRLDDGVHVAPGATLGGGVTIGRGAWVGLGAAVIQDRTIGAWTIVGAGSVVVRDLPDGVVAWGSPAKVRRLA